MKVMLLLLVTCSLSFGQEPRIIKKTTIIEEIPVPVIKYIQVQEPPKIITVTKVQFEPVIPRTRVRYGLLGRPRVIIYD